MSESMNKSDCETCKGDGELCLHVSYNSINGINKTWIRTKFCDVNKTGAPHRHNLVPCQCQTEDE